MPYTRTECEKDYEYTLLLTIGLMMSAGEYVVPGFDVIGISARTSNAAERAGKGVIPALWQRFIAEDLAKKIAPDSRHTLVALYTDYASDKDGEYTVVIGIRTRYDMPWLHDQAEIAVPAGMVKYYVPGQNYEVYVSQPGSLWEEVAKTWQQIWAEEDRGRINRSYKVDYEVYANGIESMTAEIYVGVKDR
jgi:predicted transcriptional regulator YdeE